MKFDNPQLIKYIKGCTSPYHTVDTIYRVILRRTLESNHWKLCS